LLSTKPFQLRAKPARKGEPIDVERTIQALSEWAIAHGLGASIKLPEALAYEHLHIHGTPSARCTDVPCQLLAVCRALADLLDARDGSAKRAVRDLAQAVFDASGDLSALARRFEKSPPLMGIAAEITEAVVPALQRLDEEIRSVSLNAPADVAPRGAHVAASLLLSVSQHLQRGGFDVREIALLVAVKGETEKTRVKNTRRRLQRYEKRDFRTRYSGTPDA
jgi:hypothetical protein